MLDFVPLFLPYLMLYTYAVYYFVWYAICYIVILFRILINLQYLHYLHLQVALLSMAVWTFSKLFMLVAEQGS